ncbi:hypothetical protein Nepgr_033553 [Nepenthes gracilis]|uniref:Uncharacterized protein n=1 Tax=Nepenthes gracilis TaxID=150966 RepID=A0AAD3Y8R1_NEPGR|nr:hypothetical protein Nepgr_033553 [Nepenthes gracilis]
MDSSLEGCSVAALPIAMFGSAIWLVLPACAFDCLELNAGPLCYCCSAFCCWLAAVVQQPMAMSSGAAWNALSCCGVELWDLRCSRLVDLLSAGMLVDALDAMPLLIRGWAVLLMMSADDVFGVFDFPLLRSTIVEPCCSCYCCNYIATLDSAGLQFYFESVLGFPIGMELGRHSADLSHGLQPVCFALMNMFLKWMLTDAELDDNSKIEGLKISCCMADDGIGLLPLLDFVPGLGGLIAEPGAVGFLGTLATGFLRLLLYDVAGSA